MVIDIGMVMCGCVGVLTNDAFILIESVIYKFKNFNGKYFFVLAFFAFKLKKYKIQKSVFVSVFFPSFSACCLCKFQKLLLMLNRSL